MKKVVISLMLLMFAHISVECGNVDRKVVKKHKWRQHELSLLSNLARQNVKDGDKGGIDWHKVAFQLSCMTGITRNARQCREEYVHYVMAVYDNHWTAADDELLLSLHTKYGNRWVLMSRFIKNKRGIDLKNRYALLRNRFISQLKMQNNEHSERATVLPISGECDIDTEIMFFEF